MINVKRLKRSCKSSRRRGGEDDGFIRACEGVSLSGELPVSLKTLPYRVSLGRGRSSDDVDPRESFPSVCRIYPDTDADADTPYLANCIFSPCCLLRVTSVHVCHRHMPSRELPCRRNSPSLCTVQRHALHAADPERPGLALCPVAWRLWLERELWSCMNKLPTGEMRLQFPDRSRTPGLCNA